MKDHTCHIPTIVILFLGFGFLGSLAGTIWLVANKAESVAVVTVSGLCGTALGLLGGVLVQTNRASTEATPVTVTNAASDPVPVISEDG